MSSNGQEPQHERQPEDATQDTATRLCGDLKAFLDGELTPLRRWMVQWHMARCGFCQEEERWLRRLGEDMQDLEKARPRPELRRRILASLPDTPPIGMPGRSAMQAADRMASDRQRRFPFLVGAAVVLAPLLLIGVFLLARTLSLQQQHAPGNVANGPLGNQQNDTFANGSTSRSGNTDPDLKGVLPPLPPPPMQEDPLSKAADQLVARQDGVAPDNAAAHKNETDKPAKTLAVAPTTDKKIVHLTMVAMDVGIAHDRLQALASDVGGAVTDLRPLHPHANNKESVVSAVKPPENGVATSGADHTPKLPEPPRENEPFLLIAEIPVGRAAEFRRSLDSYGSVRLTKMSPALAAAGHNVSPPPASMHGAIAPSVIITNEDGSPALAATPVPVIPVPARATVRFVIRVQAS